MQTAISLLTLNTIIKETIDTALAPSYWVIAEIGELKHGPNGHAYLELLEKEGSKTVAKIRANIWSYSYRSINAKFEQETGQRILASMKILALVTVSFHELYGISLTIKDIDPRFTLGERAKLRQATIERLQQEGLLQKNKQLALPSVPQYVGVVSSPTAAGFGDFINQLANNPYGYQIITKLFPAIMQGGEAPQSIMSAIQAAINTPKIQVIVIIRGGGAALDLECFDAYELAKNIANSPIPILTGIGHERDETIADMVAHTKLKTPTALAEFLIGGFLAYEENLLFLHKRMERTVAVQLQAENKLLDTYDMRLHNKVHQTVKSFKETIQNLTYKIKSWSLQELKLLNINLNDQSEQLKKANKRLFERASERLISLEKDIQRLNPEEHFKRGYTRTEINGLPLHQVSPKAGDQMVTFSETMKIESTIQKTEDYGK